MEENDLYLVKTKYIFFDNECYDFFNSSLLPQYFIIRENHDGTYSEELTGVTLNLCEGMTYFGSSLETEDKSLIIYYSSLEPFNSKLIEKQTKNIKFRLLCTKIVLFFAKARKDFQEKRDFMKEDREYKLERKNRESCL